MMRRPTVSRELSNDELDRVLAAIADFVDLKSPYTLGHSRGVAELAAAAAGELRVITRTVYRAGLVHDLGRMGVPNTIWDKRAPLDQPERSNGCGCIPLADRILAPFQARLVRVGSTAPRTTRRFGVPAGSTAESLDTGGGGYWQWLTAIRRGRSRGHTARHSMPTRSPHVCGKRSRLDAWTVLQSTPCSEPPGTRYDAIESGRPDSRPGKWKYCDISRGACRRKRSRNAW